MTHNMIGSLSMADIEEIEMGVYAGLILVAFGLAYLVMRAIGPRATSGAVNEKVAGSLSAQPKSHRRQQKTFGGSTTAVSRFKRTEKTMTMAREASALNPDIVRKPWGW